MNFLTPVFVCALGMFHSSLLGMHGAKKIIYKQDCRQRSVRSRTQDQTKEKKTDQKVSDRRQALMSKLPLLSRKQIIEDMDSSRLCMLAQGILEQSGADVKSIAKARKLVIAAANQPSPDPLAYYLLGQTEKSVACNYAPALYMQSIKGITQARAHVRPEQQEILDTLLKKLQENSLLDEKRIAQAQKKITAYTTEQQISFEKSTAMLQCIIDCCTGKTGDPTKPWALRACYALGMLQECGFGPFGQLDMYREEIDPLAIAACEGFEPAIYETIRLRLKEQNVPCTSFQEQYNNVTHAAKHLKKYLAECVTSDLEHLLNDVMTCMRFYETFYECVHDIPYFNTIMHTTTQALTVIIEETHDYRARCLQAIIILNRRTEQSLSAAYTLCNPLFTNKEIQPLLAMYTSTKTKKFLQNRAQTDTQASFFLGLIYCAQKKTHAQAYQYFLSGAEKNHFYSLLSSAHMILKGFDRSKDVNDALLYYKKALQYACTPEEKKLVLDALGSIANKTCIPAHCLYLVNLLQDPSEHIICNNIVISIEEAEPEIFEHYITYLRTNYFEDLKVLSKQGNELATRLLSHIQLNNIHDQKTLNPDELCRILSNIKGHCTTAHSRKAVSSIACSLAKYYKNIGNDTEALRLFIMAAEHGSQEAISMSAFLRLKMITSNTVEKDIKLTEDLADSGNIEAQKLLVSLYSGSLPVSKTGSTDTSRLFKYLTNIISQEKDNPIYMALLAKILRPSHKMSAIEPNAKQACTLFVQAKKLGYQCDTGEIRTFGILAFNIKQDEQAIELLEQCKPDKTISWLLAILYLRNQDIDGVRFEKALHALDIVLRIDNDDIALPEEGAHESLAVLNALKARRTSNAHAAELSLRLCYAHGIDAEIIPQKDLAALVNLLEDNITLSRWNLLFFLLRQGIAIHDSYDPLWELIETHILPQKQLLKTDPAYRECINQLVPVATLLAHRNIAKQPLKNAILAAHLVSTLYFQDNLLDSCLYCALAEDAITTNFHPDDFIYDSALTIGSINSIVEQSRTHQEAAITLMLYKGYRYLRGKQNIAEIIDWLELSLSIFSDLKNRKEKQDARKNKLVAMLYILFGKLTLVAYQDDNQKIFESKQYFKQALALDPQQDVARAHLAFIQLHDPSSTEKQRITAFGTLQALAKLMLPEACYMLGKVYEPGGPTLPRAIQVKKDAKKARDYLSCAENCQPSPDTKSYHSDIFCTIL